MRRGPDEREGDRALSRREVTSTREATVEVSVVMPAMSCFIIVGRSDDGDWTAWRPEADAMSVVVAAR